MIEIKVVENTSREVVDALNLLVPQLSDSAKTLELSDLENMVSDPDVNLLIAIDDDSKLVVGTLTLVVFNIPTGVRAWIEDVIVDGNARGLGIGKKLVGYAIGVAEQKGAKTVDLTSRPSRIEANALYLGVGFALRSTNVYRFEIN